MGEALIALVMILAMTIVQEKPVNTHTKVRVAGFKSGLVGSSAMAGPR